MTNERNPVCWFELPVADMTRARTFYETVLDTTLEVHDLGPLTMAWFPMHPEAPGSMGALCQAESFTPSHQGAVVYFRVPDITTALQRVEEMGGTTLNPKTSIGQFGFVGHFQDTEGNRVGLHATS